MTPIPFVTRVTTSAYGGFASSRFGPTWPVVPASFSVWQEPQGWLMKTTLPAAASPRPPPPLVVVVVDGVVPSTVFGYGRVIVGEFGPEVAPQPASPSARGMTAIARKNRRIGARVYPTAPARPTVRSRRGARIEATTEGVWQP